MEIVKSKKATVIMVILSVTFILLANAYSAQITIERTANYNENDSTTIVTRYVKSSIYLASPLDDNSFELNLMSDSIDTTHFTFALYIYFPKNIKIKNSRVLLHYTDGTTELFIQNKIDDKESYVTYDINSKTFTNLIEKEVKFITIKDIGKYTCSKPNYFSNFLQSL